MEAPTLFYDPTSEPCRAVHWLCLEAGIPHELNYTWLTRNEHLSEKFLKINPMGQLPAMQHGEFCLSEATAIMQYLTDINHCSDEWFGSDARARAVINKQLSWYHTNLRTKLTLDYFLPILLMPAYLGLAKPDKGFIAERSSALHAMLAQLDSMMDNRLYLVGNRLCGADILFACDLCALYLDPLCEQILAKYSNVSTWLGNLQHRPCYKESHRIWHYAVSLVRENPTKPGSSPGWIADACERVL